MIALITCMMSAAFQQDPAHEICAHFNMPPRGTVRKGTLFGFFGDAQSRKGGISSIPLDEPEKQRLLDFAIGAQCTAHCRHHVSGETLWYFYGPERMWLARFGGTGPATRPVPALKEKYERERGWKFDSRLRPDPARGVAIDFVPVSDKALRFFFFVLKTKRIESWETEWAFEHWINPNGSKAWDWKAVADERNPEMIECAFTEDFYVFKRKADYYFVTQSGKLYIAPPPMKGEKSRTMRALWADAKRPISAVIEDADRDKVWLFAKDKNEGAKLDVYFEMKDTIRIDTFDPAKLRKVNAKGRAKTLLEYLPLILPEPKK